MHIWGLALAPSSVGKSGHLGMEDQGEIDKSNRADHSELFIRQAVAARVLLTSVADFDGRCPQLR
jgi:hypothetical protein